MGIALGEQNYLECPEFLVNRKYVHPDIEAQDTIFSYTALQPPPKTTVSSQNTFFLPPSAVTISTFRLG